ncbi:MAG: serine dehydratase subunit alpha family protein [Pirellulales bacterium]|nr:serine dehydratase subunit alpha family protein [Pirellulales bacterium]
MNLLKEVLANEVYPAFGCTEPISCAYAAATAAAELGEPVASLTVKVDPGTYKNGAAVVVPNSGGGKGNLIAAVLGAILARPEEKLLVLQGATAETIARAQALIDGGKCRLECDNALEELNIDVQVAGSRHRARCVLAGGHTNVVRIEKDATEVFSAGDAPAAKGGLAYRQVLQKLTMAEVLALADAWDAEDRAYLRRGVEMNLSMSEWGFEVRGSAYQLRQMQRDGFLADDMFFRAKIRVGSAVDARMNGMNQAVMTSGGSGNQGVVAILTPYIVGREMGVEAERILQSIAVSHLVNAYIKCFLGEVSVICGCAMAAGIASATAIVYQQAGIDIRRITMAVSNVIGDLSGLLCDGAKPGCAMKAITSVDSAIRSALMALKGYGLSADDGLLGRTVEDSLKNLGQITLQGMFRVDSTMLAILKEKISSNCRE